MKHRRLRIKRVTSTWVMAEAGQDLELARWIYQPLERTVVRLQPVDRRCCNEQGYSLQ